MTPGYNISWKGPDNLDDLVNEALATETLESARVQKVVKALHDYLDKIPVSYMGTGWAYSNKVHDLHRLEFSSFRVIAWEKMWLSQ